MENKEKKYYLYVNGEKVVVTKEVYSAYMRPIWREERNARNHWRCRDANGVRCKRNCIECEIALLGEGATGNDLSLERLVEDEDADLIRKTDIAETISINNQLDVILSEIGKLSEENQRIMEMLMNGHTHEEIAAIEGVTRSDISHRIATIRKKLKKFLF